MRNIISIYRLEIKKSLILLLYITCICREISNLVQLIIFCKYLYIERGNRNPYVAVSSLFNNGLVIVLILTNYSLHNSMKLICGELNSEQRKTRNRVAKVIGVLFCIAMSVVNYLDNDKNIWTLLNWIMGSIILICFFTVSCALMNQLKKINSDDFKSEISSINAQNAIFGISIICILTGMITAGIV